MDVEVLDAPRDELDGASGGLQGLSLARDRHEGPAQPPGDDGEQTSGAHAHQHGPVEAVVRLRQGERGGSDSGTPLAEAAQVLGDQRVVAVCEPQQGTLLGECGQLLGRIPVDALQVAWPHDAWVSGGQFVGKRAHGTRVP